jgi:hypothetical protein
MACGMPSTALLEELAPSRGAVAALDPAPCPRLVLGRLFGLVPSLPQPMVPTCVTIVFFHLPFYISCSGLIPLAISPNIGAHCARGLDKTPLRRHPRKKPLACFCRRWFAQSLALKLRFKWMKLWTTTPMTTL